MPKTSRHHSVKMVAEPVGGLHGRDPGVRSQGRLQLLVTLPPRERGPRTVCVWVQGSAPFTKIRAHVEELVGAGTLHFHALQ